MTADLSDFDPLLSPDDALSVPREMLAKCPVAHSNHDGGFWVVNRHRDILEIMQDSDSFISGNQGVRIPHEPVARPYLPPIDSNGQEHRRYRSLENPFLTPKALAKHEPVVREIVGDLIDGFKSEGQIEIMSALAKVVPARTTLQLLFGITDEEELETVRTWIRRLSYDLFTEDPQVLAGIQADFTAWCYEVIARRRTEPSRETLLDALLEGEIDGVPLDDHAVLGAMQILTFGGFSTTSDATGNILVRLVNTPGAEARLRENPAEIPGFIEETLRLEPPVTARPRRAAKDMVIGGQEISEGDRVLCVYLAANVDPDEWADPETFREDRRQNRVMTFGAGPHRCIGSHLARMILRVMTEEFLARLCNIDYADHEKKECRVSFNPAAWRAVDELWLRFDPVR